MKKLSIFFLALIALFLSELAFGAGAIATSVTGNVTVQTGSTPPRVVRQGDTLQQADTVITGAGSAAVLRFDDGQVAALTGNSRMTITAYQYNPETGGGNILLSLIGGGMRAITGLIGKRNPSQVAYRAATATIGIRGTDTTIVLDGPGGTVTVLVTDGQISFQLGNGTPITIAAGQGVTVDLKTGRIRTGDAGAIRAELAKTEEGRAILLTLDRATSELITQTTPTGTTQTSVNPSGTALTGGAGGGSTSPH